MLLCSHSSVQGGVAWLLHDSMTRVTTATMLMKLHKKAAAAHVRCGRYKPSTQHHLASAAAALLGCYVMKRPATPAPGHKRGKEQGETRPQTRDWRWRDDDGSGFPDTLPQPGNCAVTPPRPRFKHHVNVRIISIYISPGGSGPGEGAE